MLHRRHFLRALGMMGLSLSTVEHILQRRYPSRDQVDGQPLLLCSRGEYWGRKVLTPAWEKLMATGKILDAVETGANVSELDPEDMTVGYGGLPNERGVVALDASIMYGPTHQCGSVAALEKIKRPSSVARLVMERTDHIMLVGPGALEFAIAHGFPEENLLTEAARIEWLKWKENLSDKDDWLPPADGVYTSPERKGGTINVLGMGQQGEIAGITTTSGLFGKIPGRIGDSPIIGAGLYLDNEVGAAGATGRGEELIRTCGSFLLVEKMRAGLSPQKACEAVVERIIDLNGGLNKVDFNVKMVAFNRDGDVGVASIMTEAPNVGPTAAVIDQKGFRVLEGRYYTNRQED